MRAEVFGAGQASVMTGQAAVAHEPGQSIAGAVAALIWITAGVLIIKFARFLQSLPLEERMLQPRLVSLSFYIEHPSVTKVLGYFTVASGSALLLAVLARIVMYAVDVDPPY